MSIVWLPWWGRRAVWGRTWSWGGWWWCRLPPPSPQSAPAGWGSAPRSPDIKHSCFYGNGALCWLVSLKLLHFLCLYFNSWYTCWPHTLQYAKYSKWNSFAKGTSKFRDKYFFFYSKNATTHVLYIGNRANWMHQSETDKNKMTHIYKCVIWQLHTNMFSHDFDIWQTTHLQNTHAIRVSKYLVSFSIIAVSDICCWDEEFERIILLHIQFPASNLLLKLTHPFLAMTETLIATYNCLCITKLFHSSKPWPL